MKVFYKIYAVFFCHLNLLYKYRFPCQIMEKKNHFLFLLGFFFFFSKRIVVNELLLFDSFLFE